MGKRARKAAPAEPKPEQLKQLLDIHVTYELNMLIRTHGLLITTTLQNALSNALIEAFCVHARNLDEFFQSRGKGKWKDSLLPNWFAANYTPGPALPDELLTRMNQQINHLSTGRTHGSDKLVNAAERHWMFLMLVTEATNFGKHLKSEFLPWKYHVDFEQDWPPSEREEPMAKVVGFKTASGDSVYVNLDQVTKIKENPKGGSTIYFVNEDRVHVAASADEIAELASAKS